jgi:DNA topoisomerase-3
MSYELYIAEKPSVGKAIAENLGASIQPVKGTRGPTHLIVGNKIVSWAFGHILEQGNPEDYDASFAGNWTKSSTRLPIIPEKWILKPVESSKEQLGVLKKLVSGASVVVNCGDPDREGQLLIDEVLVYLNSNKPVKRVLPNALDNTSIRKALAAIEDNAKYRGLYESGLGRQRADWMVGMNLTRACSIANQRSGMSGVLSVGRVQTPTLAMIVRRDNEIEAFKPQTYFSMQASFEHPRGAYTGKWKPSPTQKGLDSEGRLVDESVAQALVAAVSGKSGKVLDYKVEDGSMSPPLPYSLSTLQAKASQLFGMSAQRVLDVCQSLYETHKVATYPRTDCQFLPRSQFFDAPDVLKAISSLDSEISGLAKGANPKIQSKAYNDAKVTAHHAIVPTGNANYGRLSPDEEKIFRLIVKQYLAQFYPDFTYKQTSVTTEAGGQNFTSSGRTPVDFGWRKVFGADKGADDVPADDEQLLPAMAKGDSVKCKKVSAEKKQTKPPARYTEGTLIRAMTNVHELVDDPEQKKKLREVKGIGTEATRASIIETLKKRQFVEIKQGKIVSTTAGRDFIAALPKEITDVAMTAVWESALDKVESGSYRLDDFMKYQAKWLEKLTRDALNSKISIAVGFKNDRAAEVARASGAGAACPKCGSGTMRMLKAKNGPNAGNYFLGCSGFPNCKQTQPIEDQKALAGSSGSGASKSAARTAGAVAPKGPRPPGGYAGRGAPKRASSGRKG